MIEQDNAGKTTSLRLSQGVLAAIASAGTLAMIYLLYLSITLVLFLVMLLMVSDRPRQDARLAVLVPVFPLFMLVMRCWSAVAMLNEIFRRGHEESSRAPWWVLKKATRF